MSVQSFLFFAFLHRMHIIWLIGKFSKSDLLPRESLVRLDFFYEINWLTWLRMWVLSQAKTIITTVFTLAKLKSKTSSIRRNASEMTMDYLLDHRKCHEANIRSVHALVVQSLVHHCSEVQSIKLKKSFDMFYGPDSMFTMLLWTTTSNKHEIIYTKINKVR